MAWTDWIGPILGAAGGYFGSKGGGEQTDVTTTQELPSWMRDAMQWNINRGQSIANQPYTPYPGQMVAPFNQVQQNALSSANQFGQMGLGALGHGYNALTDMTGAGMMGQSYGDMRNLAGLSAMMGLGMGGMDTPQAQAMFAKYASAGPAAQAQASLADRGSIQDVLGGSYLDQDIGDYMNPYTQGVMDNVQSNMARNWQQQEQQLGSAANAARAFGGSRHGVQGALAASENQRNVGQMSNQLWNQAYGAATGLMGDDLARAMQANLANQGMDWNTQNLNAQLGTGVSQSNAAARNQMNQFNAGNLNQMNQFNAGLGTGVNQFNAANQLQNQQYGMGLGLQGLQQAMYGINAAGGMGNSLANFGQTMGNNLTNFGIQGLANQFGAGGLMQQQQQAMNDADLGNWREARDWYANRAQYGINPLSMGSGGAGTTTTPYFSQSPWLGALGGGMMGAGIDWGNMFGGSTATPAG